MTSLMHQLVLWQVLALRQVLAWWQALGKRAECQRVILGSSEMTRKQAEMLIDVLDWIDSECIPKDIQTCFKGFCVTCKLLYLM